MQDCVSVKVLDLFPLHSTKSQTTLGFPFCLFFTEPKSISFTVRLRYTSESLRIDCRDMDSTRPVVNSIPLQSGRLPLLISSLFR